MLKLKLNNGGQNLFWTVKGAKKTEHKGILTSSQLYEFHVLDIFVANQEFVRTFFISKSTTNGRTAELGAIILATCTAAVTAASATDRECDRSTMETLYR